MRDLLGPLAELQIGQLGSGMCQLCLGLIHGRRLTAVFEFEQQGPGLDPIATLEGHGPQPAGGGCRYTDILALGIAMQPAVVVVAAGECQYNGAGSEQPVHGPKPRSRLST